MGLLLDAGVSASESHGMNGGLVSPGLEWWDRNMEEEMLDWKKIDK